MGESSKSSGSNYIIQGSILAIASIVVRIIGMIYRIPVTNTIGDIGNDYYSGAFEIYNIVLLISSYSLPLAVSKMVAAEVKQKHYKNTVKLLKGAFIFALIVGTVASLATFFLSDILATKIVQTPQSALPLKVLSVAIFILAILGVLRGFFQGLGTMVPTAISQIVEQIINAIVSIAAANYLFNLGLKAQEAAGTDGTIANMYGAAGSTTGTTAGAISALIFLIAVMLVYNKKLQKDVRHDHTRGEMSYGVVFKTLVLTVIPVILSTAIYNVNGIIDQGVFKFLMLEKMSMDPIEVSRQWGIFSGKYKLLTNVPIAVASALSSSTIPALTAARIVGDRDEMRRKTDGAIRMVMLVCIPSSVGLMVLGGPITQLLFHTSNDTVRNLFLIGSFAVMFYALSTLSNGILQGIDHMNLPVIHAVIALVTHLIVLIGLSYAGLQIYASVLAYMFFAIVMCILNALSIRKHLKYRQEIRTTFAIPLVCSAIMGMIVFLIYEFTYKHIGNTLSVLICMVVAVTVYALSMLFLHGITEKELRAFPKGYLLVKLLKKVHLL